ncbi:porin [Methylomonas sp. AM2-LC]|uniref:OprO/OprP family phosphate-selective porin n=1 Tax=Methylomonas sp. AM2-LC TaxID=3153301 RepID=UPI0032656505
MKLTKLSLALTTLLSAGFSAESMALDLYVDNKTQQIFAEPGHGRTKLGSFERVEDSAAKASQAAAQQAEIDKIKEDLALKNNELKALDEHVNDPTEGKLHMDEKGVRFESKDGNFDMQLTGRLQVDAMTTVDQHPTAALGNNTTNSIADGANIRRARLGIEGAYYKDFGYKFEYDFTRGNGLSGGVTDAFMSYKGYDPLTVTIGQYKEFFSLEEATSNRFLTFLERNMATNAFSDNGNPYKVGLGLAYAQPRYTTQIGFQTESVGNGAPTFDSSSTNGNWNANRNNGSGDQAWGVTGRLTGMPWFEDKTKFLHVGMSASDRYVDSNLVANGTPGTNGTGLRFASTLDGNVDRTLILDTGPLSGYIPNSARYNSSTACTSQSSNQVTGCTFRKVGSYGRFGGETAFVYGPFSAQAEYIETIVSGTGYSSNTLNGAYGYMSYFLTGESRAYKAKTGAWDRIKPLHNFTTHGGLGAWELAVGYDHLDLNNGVIQGGRASSGKIGLNWYPNSRVRLMANFIHYLDVNTANVNNAAQTSGSNAASTATASDARSHSFNGTHPDFFEIRGQVDF